MNKLIILLLAGMALSACGKGAAVGGAQAPDAVIGTWGADCSQPFVQFEKTQMHVFPDKATYPLKAATLVGNTLTVAYNSAQQGAISEVYMIEGSTLRLDHGTYGTSEATWHKAPMNKCG